MTCPPPAASSSRRWVAKRLLVEDTRDGQAVVEVALESLLRQWRELAGWLRDEAPGPQRRRAPSSAPPPTGAPVTATKPWLLKERPRLTDSRNPVPPETPVPRPPRSHPRLSCVHRLPETGKRAAPKPRQRRGERAEAAEPQREHAAALQEAAADLADTHCGAGDHRRDRHGRQVHRSSGQPRAEASRRAKSRERCVR